MRVAIAGASGFVGSALIDLLAQKHEVIALSRSSKNNDSIQKNIEWRPCDLFSLLDAEKGLEGADVAIYLVHSMRPSAHLSQGSFEDFDLIVADNFVKAAERCGVQQIIYLGGMLPEEQGAPSRHLRSRQEVEEVFKTGHVPFTILRAALIIGGAGSSFHMMVSLVERLPVMLCPSWTQTISQPVALEDVCKSIEYVLGGEKHYGRTYDLAGPDAISYRDMMLKVAMIRGLKRKCWPVPLVTPHLSTLWVCSITGAPRSLVEPLVDGLRFSLRPGKERCLEIPDLKPLDIEESLRRALADYDRHEKPHAFKAPQVALHEARSVQRLPLPEGWTAEDVARAYMEYLPSMHPRLVHVEVQDPWVYFMNRFPSIRLLVLEFSPDRSWQNRCLFYVRGGLLSQKAGRGRLEFREALGGKVCLAAVHDFKPRLPWYLYKFTQALYHLRVMNGFAKYLEKRRDLEMRGRIQYTVSR